MNPQAEGTTYPDTTFTVEPSRVEAFREVVGVPAGIPPTFLTAAEFAVLPTIVADPRLDVDFTNVVHGGQEYDYRRPLREGEQLTIQARIDSIRIRGGNGFLTIAMDVLDAAGEPVAECRSTMIERAAS